MIIECVYECMIITVVTAMAFSRMLVYLVVFHVCPMRLLLS